MKGSTKIWIAAALCLIVIGCIIFAGAMEMLKWDFKRLTTYRYETNEYTFEAGAKSISVRVNTADLVILPSETDGIRVVCYEKTKEKHSVGVEGDNLVIAVAERRRWYEYIGIDFDQPKITLYLPQGEYGTFSLKSSTGDVKLPEGYRFDRVDISQSTGKTTCLASVTGEIRVKSSTGGITLEKLSAGSIDLSVSTGRIDLSEVNCGSVRIKVSTGVTRLTDLACGELFSEGSTGDITLKKVIVSGRMSLERDTGDIRLEACDAAEIHIETDTGDVKGTLLSEKVFIAGSDTGKVKVPHTASGGRCEIETDTGDIKIEIVQ